MGTIIVHYKYDNHFVDGKDITKTLNDMIGNNMSRYGYEEFVAEKVLSITATEKDFWAVVQVREREIQV